MGYLGFAPSSLFIFRPTNVEISDEHRTLFSEFETGAEQRRSKWQRPRMTVRMRWDRGVLTADEANDLWRFWRAMDGPHKAFDLPLFGRLTTVDSAYAGGFTLGVADTQEFTSAVGSRYQKIYVQNPGHEFDLFRIATVVDTHTLTIESASTILFPQESQVSGVINARFADSIMGLQYMVVLMTTIGLNFTEVRS